MNKAFFLQLVFNASLLLTLALIYDLLAVRWRVGRASLRQLPVGFIVGAVGVIVMLASWKLEPGIVFDTRSILIGVSGLYSGASRPWRPWPSPPPSVSASAGRQRAWASR